MKHRLMAVVTLIVLAATAMQAQQHQAPSTTSTVRWPIAAFAASTDTRFAQLMDEAMRVMHRGMHNAPQTGDPDRDFVTMMIPHHQGAIDMAKALLLYGNDAPLKRLAQEIIADQHNEVQLMQFWLAHHAPAESANRTKAMPE